MSKNIFSEGMKLFHGGINFQKRRLSYEIIGMLGVEGACFVLALLLGSGMFSIYERKILAELQRRWGPNRTGFAGTLQPLADGLKLLLKESIVPKKAKKVVFIGAPMLGSIPVGLCWLVTPFGNEESVVLDLQYGLLYFMYFLGLALYPILFGGWAANSSYPILGAARAGAQFISYELTGTFTLLIVAMSAGSFNFSAISRIQESIWLIFPLFPVFLIAFISSIAETNRPPFDLPEAESELVAGYQTEHDCIPICKFVIMEHALLIQSSYLLNILFFGGENFFMFSGSLILILKVFALMTMLIIIRAIMPRYRYDQLLSIGWKILLPTALAGMLAYSTSL